MTFDFFFLPANIIRSLSLVVTVGLLRREQGGALARQVLKAFLTDLVSLNGTVCPSFFFIETDVLGKCLFLKYCK